MPVDRKARTDLRKALARYMTGEIRTFAFDDANSEYAKSDDPVLKEISRTLYYIHDDTVDHPISVTPDVWSTLRRILAFLDTELELNTTPDQPTWPFDDREQWQANEHRLNDFALPEYDPEIHALQVHPWWNRIPSTVGFAIIAVVITVLIVAFSMT